MRERQTASSPPPECIASEDVPARAAAPDRRKWRRLRLALIARIEVTSTAVSSGLTAAARPLPSRHAVIGRLRDISNRGAYLWAGRPFATGQTLHLTLEVPPDHGRNWTVEIECETEVVRVEPGYPRTGETGLAVRILRFSIPKVLSAAGSPFSPGDPTDSPAD